MQLAKRTTTHNSKNDELEHTIDDHTCKWSMQLAKKTLTYRSNAPGWNIHLVIISASGQCSCQKEPWLTIPRVIGYNILLTVMFASSQYSYEKKNGSLFEERRVETYY
jgi:hypothetical protein